MEDESSEASSTKGKEGQDFRPNTGDRIWFWSDGDSSSFEIIIAEMLISGFPPDERGSKYVNGVYHIDIYSVSCKEESIHDIVGILSNSIESHYPRMISFLKIEEEYGFKILKPYLQFTEKAKAGKISIRSLEYKLDPQILLIVAENQLDHDAKKNVPVNKLDAIGLIVALSGEVIHKIPIVSDYFCTKRKKFIESSFILQKENKSLVGPFVGIKASAVRYDEEISHLAFFYIGKAFVSRDHASKAIFASVALDVVSGGNGNFINFYKKIYKADKENLEYAIAALKRIQVERTKAVHSGERVEFSADMERHCHALVLDGLCYRRGDRERPSAISLLRSKLANGI